MAKFREILAALRLTWSECKPVLIIPVAVFALIILQVIGYAGDRRWIPAAIFVAMGLAWAVLWGWIGRLVWPGLMDRIRGAHHG